MYYVNNKTLYVLNGSDTYEQLSDSTGETLTVQDISTVSDAVSMRQYANILKNRAYKTVVGVYILNDDESIARDISGYVSSINVVMKYNQGEVATGNITLLNYKNEWSPSPTSGIIWQGSKFRIDIGVFSNGTLIWQQLGIFVLKTPSYNDEARTVTLELHDKFSLLNGSISGKTMNTYKINVGTTVSSAIINTLSEDRGDSVELDFKTPHIDTSFGDTVTPYTLTKPPNSSYADLLIDLCNMIGCDMYYDEYGHLTVIDGIDNEDGVNKPILWDFEENEMTCSQPNIEIDFSNIVNWVTVAGQIANGIQYSATVKNENPMSQSNIYMTLPHPLYIEDKNIVGEELCTARAKWELKKQSQAGVKVNFKSIFIPFLRPNAMVTYSNKRYGWSRERFLINSISYSLTPQTPVPIMDLSLSNVNEVVFNGTTE